MIIRGWFKNRRDRSRIEVLLNAGLYEEAVAIADRGNVDSDLARIAREKLKIAEAVRNGAAGSLAVRIQDRTTALVERMLAGGPPPTGWELLAARARVRSLLYDRKAAVALDLAVRIADPEVRAQALRCVAVAVAEEQPSEARSVINSMANLHYRMEELRNLCFSRLILRDFTTAHQIAEDLPPTTEGELAFRVSNAVQLHLIKAILGQPPRAEWKEIVDFVEKYHSRPDAVRDDVRNPEIEAQVPLALLHCIAGRIDLAAAVMQETPLLSMEHGRLQQGRFGTLAMSLAYAGRREQALQLLALYTGPMLFPAEAHLLGHALFPMHAYREFAARADHGKIGEDYLTDCGSMVGLLAVDVLAMEAAGEAGAMIMALTNPEIRRVAVAQVVDFVHAALYA